MMPRLGYAAGFLVCTGLVAFALYLQHFQGQDPCPLCIVQRLAYIGLGSIFLVAAVHGPARTGATVYGGLLVVVAALGAAVAARHVWLQHLPKDRIPECGPGLAYMLKRYSPPQALEKLLAGSGECAEATWKWLGLSIAEWSLLWLVLLGAFAIYLTVKARKSS